MRVTLTLCVPGARAKARDYMLNYDLFNSFTGSMTAKQLSRQRLRWLRGSDEDPDRVCIAAATSREGLLFQNRVLDIVTHRNVHARYMIHNASTCRRFAHAICLHWFFLRYLVVSALRARYGTSLDWPGFQKKRAYEPVCTVGIPAANRSNPLRVISILLNSNVLGSEMVGCHLGKHSGICGILPSFLRGNHRQRKADREDGALTLSGAVCGHTPSMQLGKLAYKR